MTQISWARHVEERREFWYDNEDKDLENRKLLVYKFPSLWDV